LMRFFLDGQQGAIFFTFDGRNDIASVEPADEDWSERFVWRMLYGDRTVHLLWTETGEPGAPTILTVTNEQGDLFFESEFDITYRFRDGEFVQLGLPTNMWLTDEFSVIAYAQDQVLLRFVDANGDSPGMGRLEGVTTFAPLGLVEGPDGGLRLLTFDALEDRIHEHELAFEDVAEFDPDAGFGDAGVSVDLGTATLIDVLDEVGCTCRTVASRVDSNQTLPWALLVFTGLIIRRRNR